MGRGPRAGRYVASRGRILGPESCLCHAPAFLPGQVAACTRLPGLGFPICEQGAVKLPQAAGSVRGKERHKAIGSVQSLSVLISSHQSWGSKDHPHSPPGGGCLTGLPTRVHVHRQDAERQGAGFIGIRVVFSPPDSTAHLASLRAWGLGVPRVSPARFAYPLPRLQRVVFHPCHGPGRVATVTTPHAGDITVTQPSPQDRQW